MVSLSTIPPTGHARAALALAALVGLALPARAADLFARDPVYSAPLPPARFGAEIRLGGSAQDPWSAERGTANVIGELLIPRPFVPADPFWTPFVPRPTAGFSLNTGGRTSFGYVGATWTLDLTDRIFAEAFFGGAVHDGATGPRAFVPPNRVSLGCATLFREAAGLGLRITPQLSVMATVEHISNAGLCVENRGLTNVGAKIGYAF